VAHDVALWVLFFGIANALDVMGQSIAAPVTEHIRVSVMRADTDKYSQIRISSIRRVAQVVDSNSLGTIYVIPNNEAFMVECSEPGNDISDVYFVDGRYCSDQNIVITYSKNKIRSSCTLLDSYNAAFENFWDDSYFVLQQATPESTGPNSIIDSNLTLLERNLNLALFPKIDKSRISSEILGPVRKYLNSVFKRSKYFIDNLQSRNYEVSQLNSTGISSESTELIRRFTYSLTWNTPRWLAGVFATKKIEPNETELMSATLYVLGKDCPCEIGKALFDLHSLKIRAGQASCKSILTDNIGELVSMDTSPNCVSTGNALRALCQATQLESINRVVATNRTFVESVRVLHPDSMYILHFWGTWCKPCVAEMSDLTRSSNNILNSGYQFIHIASEPLSNFVRWQTLSNKYPGEHFVVNRDKKTSEDITEILAISAFPAYVVVGKRGRVTAYIRTYKELEQILMH